MIFLVKYFSIVKYYDILFINISRLKCFIISFKSCKKNNGIMMIILLDDQFLKNSLLYEKQPKQLKI